MALTALQACAFLSKRGVCKLLPSSSLLQSLCRCEFVATDSSTVKRKKANLDLSGASGPLKCEADLHWRSLCLPFLFPDQGRISHGELLLSHLQLLGRQRCDGVGEVTDAQVAVGVVIRGRECLLARARVVTR